MNSEQLQDWLTDLNERLKNDAEEQRAVKDFGYERTLLTHENGKTHYLIDYLSCNYTDVDLVQPVVAQLLACYYRGGVLRYFAIQCIPSLIHMYLLALAKRQRKSVSMFETFFLAVYNEEILAGDTASESMMKKVEEVRIPSTRFPSVYHDPKKLNLASDIALKPGTPAFVQMTVRIGPYKSLDRVTSENRQTVLTRLLKSVNSCLCRLSRDVICRYLCMSTIALCQSGFSFRESDLRLRVFGSDFPSEISDDFSKKPRLRISSQYLLESLNGLYFALFNGAPELAVQAVDAVHQRALYEFYADVILVTNSIRETLLESSFHNEEFLPANRVSPGRLTGRRGNELVTNASLRLKKMPEDITPVVVDDDSKGYRFTDSVENLKKRIAQKVEQRRFKLHFGHHRRKSESNMESAGDIELALITEEQMPCLTTDAIFDHLRDETQREELPHRHSVSPSSINSDNDALAPNRDDRVQNGSKPGNDLVIDFSTSTASDFDEAAKSKSRERNAKEAAERLLAEIRHMDSVGDVVENTSL